MNLVQLKYWTRYTLRELVSMPDFETHTWLQVCAYQRIARELRLHLLLLLIRMRHTDYATSSIVELSKVISEIGTW